MNPQLVAVLQALFVVFLWATSWVFIKIGLEEIPPITFAGLRYVLAFGCLTLVLLLSSAKEAVKRLPAREWRRLIILGLIFYAGTQGASFVALAYLPAVTVNLLWSFSSVTVALMGIVWLAERPSLPQWGGILLATLGAFVYFYPLTIPRTQMAGVFVAIAGVLANAVSSILGRDLNRSGTISPLMITVVSMGVGSAALLLTGLIVEGPIAIGLQSWLIIIWLAIVNTAFAFTLWNHTLRTLTAMESSIINGTMLIWIPVLAVLFLGERITVKEGLGLIAAGVGTLIVQLRRLPKSSPAAQKGDSRPV